MKKYEIKDFRNGFLDAIAREPDKQFTVYIGMKAAPLTLAHERIIEDAYFLFRDKKNVTIYIGVADSEWRGKYGLEWLVHDYLLHRKFHGKIQVIRQEGYTGLWKFLKNSVQPKFPPMYTMLMLGSDEKKHLENDDGVWIDVEHLVAEYPMMFIDRTDDISASAVRDIFYRDPDVDYFYVKKYISKWVYDYIRYNELFWQLNPEYRREENVWLKKYDPSVFPRPSATVDNIVWCVENGAKKVLLIRRGGHPYKGCWALPGGFLDVDKDVSLDYAAMRELREETSIPETNMASIKQFKAYSDIGIDPRTRIVDVVFSLKLSANMRSYIKAADDAAEINLFPVNDLPRLGFNHKQIIEEFFESLDAQKN